MSNPILNQLNNQNALNNPFSNMIRMLKSSNNPVGMLNNIISQNPKMRETIQKAQQYGNSPKEAFYKLAQEKGVDGDNLLKQLGLK